MAVAEEFKSAVSAGNRTMVRIMLKDSLLVDKSFVSFNEMLAYAEKRMDNLYDVHDGEVFIEEPDKWNKDYMNQQLFAVVSNFSKERLSLLKKIIAHVYATDDKNESVKEERHSAKHREKVADKQKSHSNHQLAVGLAVGGGVVAVAGVCISKLVITVAGGVAAVVGVGMLLSEREE